MGRNLFDAIGDMFRADPEVVAQREETKRARIEAATERKEQRQEARQEKRDTTTERQKNRQDAKTANITARQAGKTNRVTERQTGKTDRTIERQTQMTDRTDIRVTGRGDRLQTKAENPDYVDPGMALASEIWGDVYGSVHSVGSSVLGAFGLDVKDDKGGASGLGASGLGASGVDASEYETADIKVGANVSTSTKLMLAAVALGAIYAVGKK